MALNLTKTFSVFRTVTETISQRSCQLHQLAAKLTSSTDLQSSSSLLGAPLLNCVSATPAVVGGGWSLLSVRHAVRNYFPKPREHKRLQFTWEKRIKTEGGRAILMRHILKGRYCIAHPPSMLPHWRHKQY